MVKLIGFLALIAVLVAGVGYQRGWFTVSTTESSPGHTDISVRLNNEKIKADAKRAEDAAHKAVDAAGKKVEQIGAKK